MELFEEPSSGTFVRIVKWLACTFNIRYVIR